MKDARDFIEYLQDNPQEREAFRDLPPKEREARISELGFDFTPEELRDEMELGMELSEEDLSKVGGGSGYCTGHCGRTCEGHRCGGYVCNDNQS